jgi:hypothetical protein
VRSISVVRTALVAGTIAAVCGVLPVPAFGCGPGDVSCTSATNDNGNLGAATGSITITVTGGGQAVRTSSAAVPASVQPPCIYTPLWSGQEAADKFTDPVFQHLMHGTGGGELDPVYRTHANDQGMWYSWECSSARFDGSTSAFIDYVTQWSAGRGPIWVPQGQQPPTPPVPAGVLMALAYEAMTDSLAAPEVSFNPAERTFVQLDTWAWFDPAALTDVVVTATAPNSPTVSVRASSRGVEFSGLPAGSRSDSTCTGGGRPWTRADIGGSTDCYLIFGRSGHFGITTTMTWDITASGAALTGPPTASRSYGPVPLTALEAQAVND